MHRCGAHLQNTLRIQESASAESGSTEWSARHESTRPLSSMSGINCKVLIVRFSSLATSSMALSNRLAPFHQESSAGGLEPLDSQLIITAWPAISGRCTVVMRTSNGRTNERENNRFVYYSLPCVSLQNLYRWLMHALTLNTTLSRTRDHLLAPSSSTSGNKKQNLKNHVCPRMCAIINARRDSKSRVETDLKV